MLHPAPNQEQQIPLLFLLRDFIPRKIDFQFSQGSQFLGAAAWETAETRYGGKHVQVFLYAYMALHLVILFAIQSLLDLPGVKILLLLPKLQKNPEAHFIVTGQQFYAVGIEAICVALVGYIHPAIFRGEIDDEIQLLSVP